MQSRASTSGVPHEHLWGYVVEVREERIVYFRVYYDPAEALKAVGLSGRMKVKSSLDDVDLL